MTHTPASSPGQAGALSLLGLALLLSSGTLFAQAPAPSLPDSLSLSPSDWLENELTSQLQLGLLTEDAAEELRASYAELSLSPLDINRATEDELQRLPLLTSYPIYQLLRYRADHGAFHEVSELKLVPGWSPELLKHLRPLLRCSTSPELPSLEEARQHAQSIYRLRYGRQTSQANWQGSPDAALLELHHELPERLQLFIAGEKDAGEPWRRRARRQFSSYSFSGEFRFRRGRLLLGDYRLLRGCGLVLGSGAFPQTFHSLTPRLPEGFRALRHSTEMGFLRGVVGELRGKNWDLGLFYSRRLLDAHRTSDGLLQSITATGLHRTREEIAHRGQGKSEAYGAVFSLQPAPALHLSLQLMHQDWRGDSLHTPPGSHQQPELQDLSAYTAGSIAYRWQSISGRLRLQGELAHTDRRAWAFVQHLSLLQQSWGDVHLALWHVGQRYWTDFGRAGTHSLQPNDEQGGRLQYQFTPRKLFGTTQLFLEGYRSLSQDPSQHPTRYGYSWGVLTALPLQEHSQLTLAYHRRASQRTGQTQRLRLQYHTEIGGWGTRLTLLYSKPTTSHGWAFLGDTSGELLRGLQLRALVGYFDAPAWEARLYSRLPQLAGEYRSLLLCGRGLVGGIRLQYSPSPHWRLGLRLSHIAQRSTRPSDTAGALELIYRDF